MEEKVIQLNYGGRYQIIDDQVYSLNHGEKGMWGSTMGKKLTPKLAQEVLETYRHEENFREKKKSSIRVKRQKAQSIKDTKVQTTKTKKSQQRERRGKVSTGVKLLASSRQFQSK